MMKHVFLFLLLGNKELRQHTQGDINYNSSASSIAFYISNLACDQPGWEVNDWLGPCSHFKDIDGIVLRNKWFKVKVM